MKIERFVHHRRIRRGGKISSRGNLPVTSPSKFTLVPRLAYLLKISVFETKFVKLPVQ